MFVVCVLLGPALWCCGTGHSYMESKDSCEVQQNKWRVLQLEPSSSSGPICASCTFQCDAGAREQLDNLISGHGRRQSDPGHSDPAPVTGARPTPCHQVAPAGSHSCHQPPNCSWNISALWHWLCMARGFGAREDVNQAGQVLISSVCYHQGCSGPSGALSAGRLARTGHWKLNFTRDLIYLSYHSGF